MAKSVQKPPRDTSTAKNKTTFFTFNQIKASNHNSKPGSDTRVQNKTKPSRPNAGGAS